jgi:hypothetical protein
MTALEQMELVRDRDRLDWLKFNSRLQDVYWRIENEGGTVREAIDWFMRQETK